MTMMELEEKKKVLHKRKVLKGHQNRVTAISTPTKENIEVFISSSRDKRMVVWHIDKESEDFATPRRSLIGHSQPIQDCVMSLDGNFAMSASWDKTLRLWDLKHGTTVRKFKGHEGDVLSVAFSSDNRQIISSSRDKTIKLWNTLAECKFTLNENQHTDWISCVRFSPPQDQLSKYLVISSSWDKLVKVWDIQQCSLEYDLVGHESLLNTIAISPDGSLCASGGKDGIAMLWDANQGRFLSSLDFGSPINALAFSPRYYWLCAATDKGCKLWSLEVEGTDGLIAEATPETPKNQWCTSVAWSADSNHLFAGTNDGEIHVYETIK